MKRTPLRRKPRLEPLSVDIRAAVMVRDRQCVLAFLEPGHVCRDQWGNVHDPRDLARLTLEHVKDTLALGRRAPSDLAHLVLLDWSANLRPPTKVQRAVFRDYLASVANPHEAHVDPCGPSCRSAVAM